MTIAQMSLADLSPLANHLWQTALCVAAVWLLTLALKKNSAAVRYWLWLAASLKFLIPFSLLVALGSRFGWRTAPVTVQPQWSSALTGIGRPFAAASAPALQAVTPPASAPVPVILFCIWLCGFAVSVFFWIRWWRQMRTARKAAVPLALTFPIPVMSSPTHLEPGVFGIRKQVLLLPEGIMQRLTPAQLNAVLTHEMCHVRRRDNLTATIHMLVEAVFWFFPLVWWIRGRLIDERERACDEAVLQSGSDAEAYAEGILNVCKFYLQSPLACVSGVTGADLKRRILRIMAERLTEKLSLGRRLLLLAFCAVAIAGPLVLGLVSSSRLLAQLLQPTGAPLPSFEIASVKPSKSDARGESLGISRDRFATTYVTPKMVIEFAYNAQTDNQLVGGPGWINSDRYDIDAKDEASQFERLQKLPVEQRMNQVRLMVQSLLADRFKLKVSYATRELPVYVLVVAKNGPKLTESTPGFKGLHGIRDGRGELIGSDTAVTFLADVLSQQPEVDRTVIDNTGLNGKYNWTLKWAPDQSAPMSHDTGDGPQQAGGTPLPDPSGPSLFTAIQEQLGLKLESRKGPVQVLVIDHIEKPSEN